MAVVTYCTREMVQRELGFADTARLNARVDRACRAATRDIESLTHRVFYPTTATRKFDLPRAGSLWLDQHELTAAPTSITTGGQVMATTDYILRPDSGPPYQWIDANTSGSRWWTADATPQNAVSILGPFGSSADEDPAGTITAAIATTSATTCDISDSSLVGIGDLVRVDSERMIVTDKTYVTTSITLAGNLTASKALTTVPVSSGAGISAGETILIGSERMFVEAVTSNNLTVTRGEQATVLATHATSDVVYAPRRLTVARGQAGTTAATHLISASAYRNAPPPLIAEGGQAFAVNYVLQGSAGYATSVGVGSRRSDSGNQREPSGGGLDVLRERIYAVHGRKGRFRAVGA